MTEYTNLREISELQISIMMFVDLWARKVKTPIPRKVIVDEMGDHDITKYAVTSALNGLLKLGYIRRAIHGADQPLNETLFVQLRRV